ncbi:hypothetical protein [Marinitoga sp. 38H-ov]|uniref:hypothetical protein n=1 Tax=Marinitoga sp. 38H-ov TaxID=1755814 RepID=UPI0013EAFB88|nr:hypothetical protein [Marinitoga sp. 38H-ov]KAF2956321.1 hypothetical protein AS160_06330 [Marinitoga sp. 38H-ov]
MKKNIFLLLILFVFVLFGCTQLVLEKYYVEGYFKDDYGNGELGGWWSPFVVGAFQNGEVKGYDIANEGDTHDDYFKIENLAAGEYTLKVYTNYSDEMNISDLWDDTPNATKHINLTQNASITILFGMDE